MRTPTGHKCDVCGETEGFFHVFEVRGRTNEACENCAEEYGCTCGCFPSQIDKLFAEFMDTVLEKDEDGVWRHYK